MASHAIGRASALSGVKVTTIRYYEQIGLVPAPDRRESGRRTYDDDDVARLSFIKHARALGFEIDSIRGLLRLQATPSVDCGEADRLARGHLEETRSRIRQLQALERELERMLAACAGGEVGACEILGTLGDHARCATDH